LPLRIYHVGTEQFTELDALPDALPGEGFLWIGCHHSAFEERLAELQGALQRWTGRPLVDLHVSDLLNKSLPSHFDGTSWYDLMVFRRVAAGAAAGPSSVRQALAAVDTSAVGFAVFDRVLLTVHHATASTRNHFAQRLAGLNGGADARVGSRLPTSPDDLMLRMVNHMVDSFLDLRRLLTRQFGELQRQLLDPRSRFDDWHELLDARNTLNLLEDTCEDQHAAVSEWIDALDERPEDDRRATRHERELLRVRSRDVLEHIERVLGHVRRLEESAEAAVQLHFSALGHRTNDIMRTLTVLTAIFLPLNLVTGFFGMNFDSLPLIHTGAGLWIAVGLMGLLGLGAVAYFWRKRYLATR
jgi:Mg2+ and Co2+ transporter CorA